MYKIIFLGTPKIAQSILKTLYEQKDKVDILCAITKQDAERDRHGKYIFSEVKNFCIENKIKLFQPKKLNEIKNEIQEMKPDLIVCCAYGNIIPKSILNIPKYKSINIHTSLLPRWRGGAPIHWAIINGDDRTGVTLMYMNEFLDEGDIIFQKEIPISQNETYSSLYQKLTDISCELMMKKLDYLFQENIKTTKQNTNFTYANNITNDIAHILWNKKTVEIDRLIRGLYDEPIAFSIYNGLNIKIHKTKINSNIKKGDSIPGEILSITKNGIEVATLDGTILITDLQLPGKKCMQVKDLINGNHPFCVKEKFL